MVRLVVFVFLFSCAPRIVLDKDIEVGRHIRNQIWRCVYIADKNGALCFDEQTVLQWVKP
jgi:hypothetical protein